MAHSFNGRTLLELLDDAQRLAARALDHERRLELLVKHLEGDESPASVHAFAVVPLTSPTPEGDLVTSVRKLQATAREQRELAEALVTRFAGDLTFVSRSAWARARVLVVDDSQDNRELAAAVLEASGFHAIMASNGLEAVIVAHCTRPDIVLMDLTMPVLDGVEAARLLKASPVTQHLKVIAYTATADLWDGSARNLFADIVTKPSSPDTLLAAVQRFAMAGPAGGGGDALPES